jgi:hypothetical protein
LIIRILVVKLSVAEVALVLAGSSGIATIDEVRLRRIGAEPFR